MSISRRSVVGLVAALVLWTAMAWLLTVTVNSGGRVCSILNTVDANGEQLTQDEMRARCNRPPSPLAIFVVGMGNVVIIAAFVVRADRRSEGSSDDPPVPSG